MVVMLSLLSDNTKITETVTLASDPENRTETCQVTLLLTDEFGDTETKRLVITLAGYDFSNNLLSCDDLCHAYETFTAHLPPSHDERNDMFPMFVSKAGIGRSATLMTLYELMERHTSEPLTSANEVVDEINTIIASGRRDRHPNFVHTEQQYDALLQAALRLTGIQISE